MAMTIRFRREKRLSSFFSEFLIISLFNFFIIIWDKIRQQSKKQMWNYMYVSTPWTLCRLSIGSLNIFGYITTSKSIQKGRNQFASRQKGPQYWIQVVIWIICVMYIYNYTFTNQTIIAPLYYVIFHILLCPSFKTQLFAKIIIS